MYVLVQLPRETRLGVVIKLRGRQRMTGSFRKSFFLPIQKRRAATNGDERLMQCRKTNPLLCKRETCIFKYFEKMTLRSMLV